MHITHTWSKASKLAQLLAMLVTTALVMLGVTTLPTFAAAPTLKLAITPDETSYLSGVEQRYVVEFACASTTEDCLDSVVTITLPHTVTPAGNSNLDSAPEGVNATATAGTHAEIIKVLEDDDLVCVFFRCTMGNGTIVKVFDLYRLENGMLAEHWDCTMDIATIPVQNRNGHF